MWRHKKINHKLCEFWTCSHFSLGKEVVVFKMENNDKVRGKRFNIHFYYNVQTKRGRSSPLRNSTQSVYILALLCSELLQPWVPRPDTEARVSPTHTSWVMGQWHMLVLCRVPCVPGKLWPLMSVWCITITCTMRLPPHLNNM